VLLFHPNSFRALVSLSAQLQRPPSPSLLLLLPPHAQRVGARVGSRRQVQEQDADLADHHSLRVQAVVPGAHGDGDRAAHVLLRCCAGRRGEKKSVARGETHSTAQAPVDHSRTIEA
jgi:hypothetical protein